MDELKDFKKEEIEYLNNMSFYMQTAKWVLAFFLILSILSLVFYFILSSRLGSWVVAYGTLAFFTYINLKSMKLLAKCWGIISAEKTPANPV